MRRTARWLGWGVAVGAPALAVLGAIGLAQARADPVVRRARLDLPDWPAGAPPIRVALLTDLHAGSPSVDRDRLERVVALAVAERPDLVLLAGDYVDGHRPADAADALPQLAALGRLKPPLGIVAVLGNHDWWTDAPGVRRALERAGATVLDNAAVVRGSLAIAGVGDLYTRHARIGDTLAAQAPLKGARVVLTHSPDVVPKLPAAGPSLVLAGHTHCGQVVLPLLGPPSVPVRTGRRYLCGVVREPGRTTVVPAGIGTSVLPVRFGAPPDLWLLQLGAPRQRARR
jgi:uncharacterized protein